MPKIHAYHIIPSIPERLLCLVDLAYNLRWAWDHETIELFRRLDRDLWETSGHNPVLMLGTIDQGRLTKLAKDEAFLAHMDRVYRDFTEYLKEPGWFARACSEGQQTQVAYFSAEFGLTECVPIYAGGLGFLAGDHLKSASNLGIPLVGVGLLYQKGYFRQYLNVDGWQQETYPLNDFYNLPVRPVKGKDGQPVEVSFDFPGRKASARVWWVQVGRIPLYLLDTNIPSNSPQDQDITDELYGGDREMRIQQEIVLGVGGMRALKALGIRPTVCHMNEGHSAFLALERARMFMEEHGVTYKEARQATCAGNLFTTHTPVAAGFDLFDPGLMRKYFEPYAERLGVPFDHFLAFGRSNPYDPNESFNMAVLASKHSSYTNGVSRLHAKVTRRMVRRVWQDFPEHEVPVTNVTNGIHTRSWISREMAELLNRYLGPQWYEDPTATDVWDRIDQIPDEELWRTHERRKERLISYARRRLAEHLKNRGASESEVLMAGSVLNSESLTIGFARRFATYKRATLLLRDVDRIKRILSREDRPVQILFAGKAHPRDDEGKEFIRQIIHFARDEQVRRRVVFLEDYDMAMARYLVQGVDVWLNTPRRPLEASGTSGMKVLANGGLNLSILDGWWCEGYDHQTGWAIGNGEEYENHDYQDRVESNALYNILENDVIPLYYARGVDNLPHGWISKMKASMRELCPVFNTNRMVAEYTQRFYLPACQRYRRLSEDQAARAKAVVEWRHRMWQNWKQVRVLEVESPQTENVSVGSQIPVKARVQLGNILPSEVSVQLYRGQLDVNRLIQEGTEVNMQLMGTLPKGIYAFQGEIPCEQSGLCGFTVRVVPFHPDAIIPYELPLITWEA
jgi:starch phosphorylase